MKWLAVIALLWPLPLKRDLAAVPEKQELIIWNVGQGLWVTWRTPLACHHFDAGGERAPWRLILSACRARANILHFSHWDSDHIGLATALRRRLPATCIATMPAGAGSAAKHAKLESIPRCASEAAALSEDREAAEISFPQGSRIQPVRAKRSTTNEASRIYVVEHRVILPGDSTSAAEKQWGPQIPAVDRAATLLVLGHHGSRTSTSATLLSQLTGLHQAVASARKSRYGHPHKEVAIRLRQHGIAMLKTEEWGTLVFKWGPRDPQPPIKKKF